MERRECLAAAGALLVNVPLASESAAAQLPKSDELITAAYYFGNFHVDPRNEKAHGADWTEWNLVKTAQPRFPGHDQPRIPEWRYGKEATPEVFRKKIAAAKEEPCELMYAGAPSPLIGSDEIVTRGVKGLERL